MPLTPRQEVMRRRVKTGLRVAGPLLDLLLLAGERASRVVDRSPDSWIPPHRMEGAAQRAQIAARAGRDEER